jgi:peptidoglycan/LPS O-acetylase OafA/YrhL
MKRPIGLRLPLAPDSEAFGLARALSATHLPALDGLRALAVTMVVASHVGLPALGGLGVTVFFVLSGFLITWLLIKECDSTGSVSLRAFYARRALRIFPAYYAFLALSITVDLKRGDARIVPIALPAIFYYTNYFNALMGHSSSSVAHAWSLAVEEQFYLLWPAAFMLLSARGSRALLRGLVFAIAAVASWRSYAYLGLGLGPSYVYNAFDCRFDCLAAGCLLAVACGQERFRSAMDACARAWRGLPLLAAATLLPLVEIAGDRYRYTVGFTAEALLIAFAIAQLLVLHAGTPWRLLDARPIRYLGRVSYGMYLYHQWGLSIGRHLAAGPRWLELSAGLAATILLATGSYFVIERPFLSLKSSLSRVARRPFHAASVTGVCPT